MKTKMQAQPARAPKPIPDPLIAALLKEWRFFVADEPLAFRMLRLRHELGDSYFDHEYASFKAQASSYESREDLAEASDLLEKNPEQKGLLQHLFDQLSAVLGFGSDDEKSDNESVTLYRSFMSETIYDHLAMLARSPHTMRGGAFSIRKELTVGIAEEIGLGLYLSPEINEELHHRTETALLQLASDYQKWLLYEKQGMCETTWGNIYTSDRELTEDQRKSRPLILTPDVAMAATAVH